MLPRHCKRFVNIALFLRTAIVNLVKTHLMLSMRSSLAVLSFLLGGSTLNDAGLSGGLDLRIRRISVAILKESSKEIAKKCIISINIFIIVLQKCLAI